MEDWKTKHDKVTAIVPEKAKDFYKRNIHDFCKADYSTEEIIIESFQYGYVQCLDDTKPPIPNGLPDVKRYDIEGGSGYNQGLAWGVENSTGEYVKYSDYEHMRSLADNDISRLKEAAKNLLSLHAAEMEGIILPTKEQWFKAVTELEKEAYRESCK